VLVCGIVVDDHVHLPGGRGFAVDLVEEADELLAAAGQAMLAARANDGQGSTLTNCLVLGVHLRSNRLDDFNETERSGFQLTDQPQWSRRLGPPQSVHRPSPSVPVFTNLKIHATAHPRAKTADTQISLGALDPKS
jgi:hypothetical protein